MHVRQPGIILFTENYEACVRFYRDILGLPLLFPGEGLTTLKYGGAYLMVESHGVANAEGKERAENPTVLRFNVDDVSAAADELQEKGVTVEVLRFDWGTIGVFYDPDGNRCELKDHWDAEPSG